jgi:hypothetical protein
VEEIAFSVGMKDTPTSLRFESCDAPAERLAVYTERDGELGDRVAIVIPPRRVHWSAPALERWARQELIPTFAEGEPKSPEIGRASGDAEPGERVEVELPAQEPEEDADEGPDGAAPSSVGHLLSPGELLLSMPPTGLQGDPLLWRVADLSDEDQAELQEVGGTKTAQIDNPISGLNWAVLDGSYLAFLLGVFATDGGERPALFKALPDQVVNPPEAA